MATKSSRSGSKQHHQQQLSRRPQRGNNYNDDYDDDDVDDKSRDSNESPSPPEPASPHILSRDGVLAALGYRSGNVPQPSAAPSPGQAPMSNACRRCGKRVYPLELIDIGDRYHRGCFKCHVSASTFIVYGSDRGVVRSKNVGWAPRSNADREPIRWVCMGQSPQLHPEAQPLARDKACYS